MDEVCMPTKHDRKRGKLLKHFRELKNLSQSQLAAYIGVTSQTVYNWEHGKGWLRIDTVNALCLAMGISLESLVEIDEKCGCKDVDLDEFPDALRERNCLNRIHDLLGIENDN
jgi:transcriptional regulator with XRE-family HTH domain